jgi:hypothetical protein
MAGREMRRLERDDMDAAARVHRASFDQALPWLTGLHTDARYLWMRPERLNVDI